MLLSFLCVTVGMKILNPKLYVLALLRLQPEIMSVPKVQIILRL